ncbi:DUF2177 family protein [Lichenihabitans psoromatis]|uniref:DUF2177 family protein n=1 Tax=Lichenihabitans psoromatis TaxID=2528642 RepID=UPI0010382EF5|nr:DUF2177 family protein [Lichenihabitans psoromatis]
MLRLGTAYAATLVAMLVLDFAWLGTVGGPLFKRSLGDSLAPNFSLGAAGLFYLLYAAGIVYFALLPAFDAGSWSTALTRGLLLGFFAYMTYDLTNLATLRNYTVALAITDMIWGAIVTGASAAIAFWVADMAVKRFG